MTAQGLVIVGASVRAAAGSALRAGRQPWCVDLFADADLAAIAPVTRIDPADYPQRLRDRLRAAPPGPWLYTGGLENHPALVRTIATDRPLLGNDAAALRRARSPEFLAQLFRSASIPHPALAERTPLPGRWLVKPRAGAGGRGIHFHADAELGPRRGTYLQEFIAGEPCSAVYVGDGARAELLGVTEQLVGVSWLRAAPFHYCGSIGPLEPTAACQQRLRHLGDVVAAGCGLRGLFGVDFVLAGETPFPIEVNPRYPASVEVLEHALGIPALANHLRAFGQQHGLPAPQGANAPRSPIVGKGILFAAATVTFPADGPWRGLPFDPWQLPAFADLPHPGDQIEAGRPVLTLFAQADSVAACREQLERIAADTEHWLFRTSARPLASANPAE